MKVWARLLLVLVLVGVGVPALLVAEPVVAAPARFLTVNAMDPSGCAGSGVVDTGHGLEEQYTTTVAGCLVSGNGGAPVAGQYCIQFTNALGSIIIASLGASGDRSIPFGASLTLCFDYGAGSTIHWQVYSPYSGTAWEYAEELTVAPRPTSTPTVTVTPGGATVTSTLTPGPTSTPVPTAWDCGLSSFPLLNCNLAGYWSGHTSVAHWSVVQNHFAAPEGSISNANAEGLFHTSDSQTIGFQATEWHNQASATFPELVSDAVTAHLSGDLYLTYSAIAYFPSILASSFWYELQGGVPVRLCAGVNLPCSGVVDLGAVASGSTYQISMFQCSGGVGCSGDIEAALTISSVFVAASGASPTWTATATASSTPVATGTPEPTATFFPTITLTPGPGTATPFPTSTPCPIPTAGGGVSTELLSPCLPLTRAIADCGTMICQCLHYVADTISGQLHQLDQDVVGALGDDLSASILHPGSVGSVLTLGFLGIGSALGTMGTEEAGILADETAIATAEGGQLAAELTSCNLLANRLASPVCASTGIHFSAMWVQIVPQHLSTDLLPAEQSISDHMVGFSGALDGLIPFQTAVSTAPSFSARLFAGGATTHVTLAAGFFSGAGLLTKFRAVCSFMLVVAWLVWVSRWFRRLVE
jgi:hypothetical protein